MKRPKRKTKADILREDFIRQIEVAKKSREFDITEKHISYQELKSMYLKRVEEYRALERKLEREREKAKHTSHKDGSRELEMIKKIVKAIVLEGREKTEADILYEIGYEFEGKNYNEKKFSKKFKTWKERHRELYVKIFYDTCYEEFQKGNLKSSELPYFTYSITAPEK